MAKTDTRTQDKAPGDQYVVLRGYIKVATPDGEITISEGEITDLIPTTHLAPLRAANRIRKFDPDTDVAEVKIEDEPEDGEQA